MKIEEFVKTASAESRLEIYCDGAESAAVFCGERKVLSITRIRTGNFDEALGLPEKLRRHMTDDCLFAEAQSVNVIPFGCEYHAARQWKFAGNIGELTDDISADNGGRIEDLYLEDVIFPGGFSSVEYLLAGENEMRVFTGESGTVYDGGILPVCVRVNYRDGYRAEFYCGDDFWRHECAAVYDGASAQHIISADAEGIKWTRHVLIMPEDAGAEKRAWRFKSLFAVSVPDAAPVQYDDPDFERNGCFAAASMHRDFRAFIRKFSGEKAMVKISGDICCSDGSHISRPGKKIRHGMIGEIFDEYIWGSAALAGKGAALNMAVCIPQLGDSVITANLLRQPGKLEFCGMEDE